MTTMCRIGVFGAGSAAATSSTDKANADTPSAATANSLYLNMALFPVARLFCRDARCIDTPGSKVRWQSRPDTFGPPTCQCGEWRTLHRPPPAPDGING